MRRVTALSSTAQQREEKPNVEKLWNLPCMLELEGACFPVKHVQTSRECLLPDVVCPNESRVFVARRSMPKRVEQCLFPGEVLYAQTSRECLLAGEVLYVQTSRECLFPGEVPNESRVFVAQCCMPKRVESVCCPVLYAQTSRECLFPGEYAQTSRECLLAGEVLYAQTN